MVDRVDCVVVGAGVIGLAVARALSLSGHEVIVLEGEATTGAHTSSRNSEVIHAGIYYAANSLKARLCVPGKEALYAYCASRGIAHRRTGKLIVATAPDQIATLERLRRTGRANGVTDLELIDGQAALQLEPRLRSVGALLSPSSGILDSHALMLSLQGEAESHGCVIALRHSLRRGVARPGEFLLDVAAQGGENSRLSCRVLVNAAGLGAPAVARSLDGMPDGAIPSYTLVKGSYFGFRGRAPFTRLVYPVPGRASLGIHFTLDLAGQARFGPDQEVVTGIDYGVDPARARHFYTAVREFFPGLEDDALQPAYSGIRPRVDGGSGGSADFTVQGPDIHGVVGLINLFGIESPGLTSSLAIGEHVRALIDGGSAG